MAPTKQPPAKTKSDIVESVASWRRESLERAGYEGELAERIARSDADLHRAVALLEQGCPPELAADILL